MVGQREGDSGPFINSANLITRIFPWYDRWSAGILVVLKLGLTLVHVGMSAGIQELISYLKMVSYLTRFT